MGVYGGQRLEGIIGAALINVQGICDYVATGLSWHITELLICHGEIDIHIRIFGNVR